MRQDERATDVLADSGATQPLHRVPPDYTERLTALGGSVVRQTPPPSPDGNVPEITAALETAWLPRWRAGGVVNHAGLVCPLCVAGYAWGRAESTPLPEMAILCYSCQREIEAICLQVAAFLSKRLGYAVYMLDVLKTFFATVMPIAPLMAAR